MSSVCYLLGNNNMSGHTQLHCVVNMLTKKHSDTSEYSNELQQGESVFEVNRDQMEQMDVIADL